MSKRISGFIALVVTVAFGFGSVYAEGIPAKLKSRKVKGDLVPAYEHADPEEDSIILTAEKKTFDAADGDADGTQCSSTAVACTCGASGDAPDGTGDGCFSDDDCLGGESCCGNETCADANVGNDCLFKKGKFKTIIGKDPQIKMIKVRCGVGQLLCERTGEPCTVDDDCEPKRNKCVDTGAFLPEPVGAADFNPGAVVPSRLCAHIEILSTIMDEDFDKDGNSGGPGSQTCNTGSIDAAGTTNYAVSQASLIDCKKGRCKGALGVSVGGAGDPCPTVDKVSELRHVRVMDGPELGTVDAFGNDLTGCCAPGVVAAGGFGPNAACAGVDQDVLAEMGTVVQTSP